MDSAAITPIYAEQELTEKILAGAFAVHNTLGCGFLASDIADDTEALRDQLNDALVEGAESLAKCEEFSVGFGHAASLRAVSSAAAAR